MLHHAIDYSIKRLRSHAANFLTLTNLCLGTLSILVSLNNQLRLSVLLIFIAALLDRLDGFVARKLNIVSDLGKQLDSMCDIISFGIAPAILLYQGVLNSFNLPGVFFTIFYIACGAFRLARFNITENKGYYTGLPITVAGCVLALCFLLEPQIPSFLFLFIIIILSILMIVTYKIKKI